MGKQIEQLSGEQQIRFGHTGLERSSEQQRVERRAIKWLTRPISLSQGIGPSDDFPSVQYRDLTQRCVNVVHKVDGRI